MKIVITKSSLKKINELTGKKVDSLKLVSDNEVIATDEYSTNLSSGIYNCDIEILYTDDSQDLLQNQRVVIKDRDKLFILSYAKILDLILAILVNPLTWIGVVLATLITYILGISGIFLYALCGTFAMNNPTLYRRKGIEIFKVK